MSIVNYPLLTHVKKVCVPPFYFYPVLDLNLQHCPHSPFLSQASRVGLEPYHWLSWVFSLETADRGTSQPPDHMSQSLITNHILYIYKGTEKQPQLEMSQAFQVLSLLNFEIKLYSKCFPSTSLQKILVYLLPAADLIMNHVGEMDKDTACVVSSVAIPACWDCVLVVYNVFLDE